MSDWGVVGLDGDPTPGDPERTAELAGRLLPRRSLPTGAARGCPPWQRRRGLHMEGDYAAGFRQMLSERPHELGKLSNAYRGGGGGAQGLRLQPPHREAEEFAQRVPLVRVGEFPPHQNVRRIFGD